MRLSVTGHVGSNPTSSANKTKSSGTPPGLFCIQYLYELNFIYYTFL